MNKLRQERTLENNIEKASLELEVEALKEKRDRLEELLKQCEAEAKRRGLKC